MSVFEKAKIQLEKDKKDFPEFFEKLAKAAPGEAVKMPKEFSDRIWVEHAKNLGDKLQIIDDSIQESYANAHNTAPKVYV